MTPDRPAWWPKNSHREGWPYEHAAYEKALQDTWDTVCGWLDTAGEHDFLLLQSRVHRARYPSTGERDGPLDQAADDAGQPVLPFGDLDASDEEIDDLLWLLAIRITEEGDTE